MAKESPNTRIAVINGKSATIPVDFFASAPADLTEPGMALDVLDERVRIDLADLPGEVS
ncbi:hypothetical protein OHA71_06425 [Streptomyces sp. NBC_00444]